MEENPIKRLSQYTTSVEGGVMIDIEAMMSDVAGICKAQGVGKKEFLHMAGLVFDNVQAVLVIPNTAKN